MKKKSIAIYMDNGISAIDVTDYINQNSDADMDSINEQFKIECLGYADADDYDYWRQLATDIANSKYITEMYGQFTEADAMWSIFKAISTL